MPTQQVTSLAAALQQYATHLDTTLPQTQWVSFVRILESLDDPSAPAAADATSANAGPQPDTAAGAGAGATPAADDGKIMSNRAVLLQTVLNARKSMTKDSLVGVYPGSQVQIPYVHNPNWSKIDPLYVTKRRHHLRPKPAHVVVPPLTCPSSSARPCVPSTCG